MRKLLIALFLIPIWGISFAQDWHPFPEGQTAFFRHTSGQLRVVKVDSIKETESETKYYNRRDPYYVELTEDYQLYDPYTSWIGYSTLVDDEKVTFQNYENEPVSIYLNRENEDPWLFYTFENGNYIEARVVSMINMNILDDLEDEVKVIRFQTYDSTGNYFEHDINSDSLIISKNHGFVKTYTWVKFPLLLHFELWGLENNGEIYGDKYDIDELASSHQVGDEVHLYKTNQYQKIEEYIGKRQTNDYVEYDIKTRSYNYGSISYETRRHYFGDFPCESKFDENGNFIGFHLMSVSNNLFQDQHKYSYRIFDNFEWVEYEGEYYWGRNWSTGTGSGPFENSNSGHMYTNSCNGDGDCWDMVYVNNTNGEWGEPLEFEVEPYTMIRPDMQNIFAKDDFFDSEVLIGTRIDTIEYVGSGVTRYYNYKSGEKYLYDEEREYIDPNGSWTGMYHEIDMEGVTIFFNEYYEPIVFYPNADIGFTWPVFSSDDYEYEGEITGINYQEILPGLMDSVKLISITSKKGVDKGSRYQFRLSKNYGLLDIPYLYGGYFSYTRTIKSIQKGDEFYGRDYEIDQIFNGLEIGHEIHYSFSDDDHWYQIKRELIAKNNYPKKVEYIYKRYQFVDQNWPIDTNYYELIYDTIEYPQNLMPCELVLDQEIFGREFYMEIRSNTSVHCDEELKRFDIFPYHRRSYIERDGRLLFSMTEHNGLSDGYNNDFVDQVGHYRAFQSDTDLGYDHIKYIKSPNLTCGEPYWFEEDDYLVVRPELKSYYRYGSSVRGIRIDSAEIHDDFVRYYNYRNIEGYEYAEAEYRDDPNASWTGMYIDVYENGDNVFYDQDYIPFTIKTKAQIGDEWLASEFYYGSIYASVLSVEYHEILPDVYDSVKWIRLTRDNNNLDIRLSKNYGLIDFPRFYRFYVHTLYLPSLVGIETEEELIGTNFNLNKILLSLNVGDEMHYRNTAHFGSFFKRKVIGKDISDKKVTYRYEICGQMNETYPIDTSYYMSRLDTVEFPINIMPREIIMDTSVFGSEFYMNFGHGIFDDYCYDMEGIAFAQYIKHYEFEVDGRIFWNTRPNNHFSSHTNHRFVDGIGNFIGPLPDSDADYDIVDYYLNGELSCGEPYEISCDNTGLNELVNSNISISPNPTTGIVHLSSSPKKEEVKIFNINGQIVKTVYEMEDGSLDLNDLENGVYLIEITTKNQQINHQKLIINK